MFALALVAVLPASASPEELAEATVEFALSEAEWTAINELSAAGKWGEVPQKEKVSITVTMTPMLGVSITSEPQAPAVTEAFTRSDFHRFHPEFGVVYLPAERRLLPPTGAGIDLAQLDELISLQKTAESRQSVQAYGRLDDQEFEQFAKALCVADSLPSDGAASEGTERIQWSFFKEVVDSLIAPKELLGLSREHPEALRICTPSGAVHAVQQLSSGERQALIIVSRVLRAGAGHSLVLIDEPDAYLHPHLSQRLMEVLVDAVGEEGQLIVATHSPSVLDSLNAASIIRFQYGGPPAAVADEPDRVAMYRSAGFRASALTQSEMLVLVEGETDEALLPLLFPLLARTSLRAAGGRAQVLERLASLLPFDVPVIGAIDRDVLAAEPKPELVNVVIVWPTADLEGAFLRDDRVLQAIVSGGLAQPAYADAEALAAKLDDLVEGQQQNAVAELAQNMLRDRSSDTWPSPRGDEAISRLRTYAVNRLALTEEDVQQALDAAEALWTDAAADRLALVRGKRIIKSFVKEATVVSSAPALLDIVARQLSGPPEGLRAFGDLLDSRLT